MRTPTPALTALAARGLSRKDVVQALGYSPSWVSLCLSGREQPSQRFVLAFSALVGLPPSVVFPDLDVEDNTELLRAISETRSAHLKVPA